jgi:hypothetical protein
MAHSYLKKLLKLINVLPDVKRLHKLLSNWDLLKKNEYFYETLGQAKKTNNATAN